MKWANNFSKPLDWVNKRDKIKTNSGLFEKFTFQREKIAQIILDDNIHVKIILNFEQAPLRYTSPNKITYINKGSYR